MRSSIFLLLCGVGSVVLADIPGGGPPPLDNEPYPFTPWPAGCLAVSPDPSKPPPCQVNAYPNTPRDVDFFRCQGNCTTASNYTKCQSPPLDDQGLPKGVTVEEHDEERWPGPDWSASPWRPANVAQVDYDMVHMWCTTSRDCECVPHETAAGFECKPHPHYIEGPDGEEHLNDNPRWRAESNHSAVKLIPNGGTCNTQPPTGYPGHGGGYGN